MLSQERCRIILENLNRKKVVSVPELSIELKTSEVTIRRDLQELEDEGKLKRVHGGAIPIETSSSAFEPLHAQLQSENIESKKIIAKAAYDFIAEKSAIILDSSTTAMELCKLICDKPIEGLVVVSNCVRIIVELTNCTDIELIMIGGVVRKNLISCTGTLSETMMEKIRVDKAFIGINGIDLVDDVLTTPNLSEAAIKQSMIRCAKESIILADHTKFDHSYLGWVSKASDVNCIITNSFAGEGTILEAARNCGTEIIVANEE